MPSIKFNFLTKEIDVKGSESFIESNLNKIQDLLVESIGVKKMIAPEEAKAKQNQERISFVRMTESQAGAGADIKRYELSEASLILPAINSSVSENTHEMKANRPPLKKYIRKVGMPGDQKIEVEVVEQKPREISIASLREKFGLSESKFGGILRDAEKYGKIKRVMDGSYVWAED